METLTLLVCLKLSGGPHEEEESKYKTSSGFPLCSSLFREKEVILLKLTYQCAHLTGGNETWAGIF